MDTISVVTNPAYGGTNEYQWRFLWYWMTLESNMLGINTRGYLITCIQNIILYQCTGLGNYILELVWIGTINTKMSPCLCQDMWRYPWININTKSQHALIMYHINGKYQIMGTKLRRGEMRVTNISSYPKTENMYKMWWETFSIMQEQLTPPCW